MMVLDTNIISELMSIAPNQKVINWLEAQIQKNIYITTITLAEIHFGIMSLPAGKKRDRLDYLFLENIQSAFPAHRILKFCSESAFHYGQIMANSKKNGKTMSVPDGQIASITKLNRASLITRKEKDFENLDIHIINPFN